MRILLALALLATTLLPVHAQEPPRLVLGVQEAGTVQWEIETIKRLGLDRDNGVVLDIRPLADSRAGQIALQAGAVDVILSDFVWVAVQRAQGNTVTMVPHSLAVGAVMVPQGSAMRRVENLAGTRIAVAGGPVDKSWVILQALYHARTGQRLAEEASVDFGAPPLVNELLLAGRADAALNFWQWNARVEGGGATTLLSVPAMLAELGVPATPPLLGWTFSESTAASKRDALTRFFRASFAAKAVLATDDGAWDALRPLMGAGEDDALFARLRDGYRAGIVQDFDPADVPGAAETFALLAGYGGADLAGDLSTLPPGIFWSGYTP